VIERISEQRIEDMLSRQKVSLLLGARRVGKTSLLENIYNKYRESTLWLNGEDADTLNLLETRTAANYKRILQGYRLLIIDEAQHIPDIGRKAKLMIDSIQPLHIILTGSSAFDLHQAGEPLVRRMITHTLFPLAQEELGKKENALQTLQNLEERLIYGSYPEVITLDSLALKQQYLQELVSTYLLKDILAFENIRNPQKLKDLLVLLAFQIGNEVSLEELGKNLSLSKNTVDRYLDLLSKVFVIYRRNGFSRNLRKEIVKSHRWYFTDNGIRNALINQFQPLALRQDNGLLWENYWIGERLKFTSYRQMNVNSYFWRTYDQQEIDLVEEKNGKLTAFECKWKNKKVKAPVAFSKAYPDAEYSVITPENYLEKIG
jgi:predicted AAA+ superfamily ATPase